MRGRTNAVSGTVLPELSNPAGAANIQSGYQAINGEGEVVTGTAAVREGCTVQVIYSGSSYQSMVYSSTSGTVILFEFKAGQRYQFSMLKNSMLVFCYGYDGNYNQRQPNDYTGATLAEYWEINRSGAYFRTDFLEITGDVTINIDNS